MSIYFEKVSRFADIDLPMPQRGTSASAGYDFVVAEDIVLPPFERMVSQVRDHVMEGNPNKDYWGFVNPLTLDEMAGLTKELKAKVSLVTTGMKCKMPKDVYLELTVRSSTPLKHWIVMANGQGIIDADYYGNRGNEGEIFFQLLNLAPFAIKLKRGDKIGQGIFHQYLLIDNDEAIGKRVGGLGSTTENHDE